MNSEYEKFVRKIYKEFYYKPVPQEVLDRCEIVEQMIKVLHGGERYHLRSTQVISSIIESYERENKSYE